MGKLSITYQNVSELKPYASNARTHSRKQTNQIAASIEEFGFTNPVLVDEDGQIIAGHGRVKAAQQLGLTEIPTVRLGHLTRPQKRALRTRRQSPGRECRLGHGNPGSRTPRLAGRGL